MLVIPLYLGVTMNLDTSLTTVAVYLQSQIVWNRGPVSTCFPDLLFLMFDMKLSTKARSILCVMFLMLVFCTASGARSGSLDASKPEDNSDKQVPVQVPSRGRSEKGEDGRRNYCSEGTAGYKSLLAVPVDLRRSGSCSRTRELGMLQVRDTGTYCTGVSYHDTGIGYHI